MPGCVEKTGRGREAADQMVIKTGREEEDPVIPMSNGRLIQATTTADSTTCRTCRKPSKTGVQRVLKGGREAKEWDTKYDRYPPRTEAANENTDVQREGDRVKPVSNGCSTQAERRGTAQRVNIEQCGMGGKQRTEDRKKDAEVERKGDQVKPVSK
ncbi:uncharacterized protein LAESUDRAFT_718501 [Laetiporus sulphureus 93-53]|uniref:Uncharacterized protein n=1 Tax=Laetiporus sulphureus 93-53 TaxID=1314785 RepID=A0A165AWI0_9APHY|nr:uncharacterized protein LAESUDRAFT_718501 [Laetiporus sulphureus 93-53]KZS99790.1 hypothetical protein LAESUDRAFT_718501 [Laetiporus sulphureus 93-53]